MDSYTLDGINTEGEWEWEWEWSCFVPMMGGGEGGGDCLYEDGEVIEMPARDEGIFVGGGNGKRFEVGAPLFFVVNMRVREGDRVISEGHWEEVFSVVEGDLRLEIEETQWLCENGAMGYLVCDFLI